MPILLAKILGAKVACYLVPAMLAKRLACQNDCNQACLQSDWSQSCLQHFMTAKRMVPVLLAQWLVPVLLEKMRVVVVVVVVSWLVCGYDRWSFVVMMGGRCGRFCGRLWLCVVVSCGRFCCCLWCSLSPLVV